jgi:molybdate transport system substrate-binding protein
MKSPARKQAIFTGSGRLRRRSLAAAAVAIFMVCVGPAGSVVANAAEIRIISANGLRPVLAALAGRFEAASGDKAIFSFDETGVLLQRIKRGESSDVYILPKPALEGLMTQGKIAPDSVADIASTTLGMAVRSGAPTADTSTVDGFRRWLLGVNAIVMTDPAAGGVGSAHFLAVLQRLGIADEMKPRLILTPGAGDYNAELVAAGKADVAVQLSHLIRQVHGVELVSLPAEFEFKVTFSAGVAAATKDPASATKLIRFLSGPDAVSVIEAAGMRPG